MSAKNRVKHSQELAKNSQERSLKPTPPEQANKYTHKELFFLGT